MDEVEDDNEGDEEENDARRKRGDGIGACRALGALYDNLSCGRHIEICGALQSVVVEYYVEPVFIVADDEAGYELLYDLAEGKSDYGEIVSAKAENGDTDKKSGNSRENSSDDHRKDEAENGRVDRGGKALGYDDPGKGADAHKARVAEAELAHNADGQIKGDRHNGVAADRN